MRNFIYILVCTGLGNLLVVSTTGQEIENRQVVVQAEAGELPSAYGAPPDLSHGRISTLTKSYVLSPFSFELEAGYEGDLFRHGLPDQLFRQEIEMGLPAPSQLACKTRSSVSIVTNPEYWDFDLRQT